MRHYRWYSRGLGVVVMAMGLVFLLTTCKKQDERSGIVGKVMTGSSAATGATVYLYDASTFDENSVWSAPTAHAAIGVPYTPQAVFDWRRPDSPPVASVGVSGDGSFNFGGLSTGQYVIVAARDSVEWTDPVRANLGGSKLDVGTIAMPHVTYFMSDTILQADAHWVAGEHYALMGRLTVGVGTTLTIDPGAVVRIAASGGTIYVLGAIHAVGTPDKFIRITSNEPTPGSGDWRSIAFSTGATPPLFRYCAFSYGDLAINSVVPGGRVEDCCFTHFVAEGLSLTGGPAGSDSVVVRGCSFENIPISVYAGQELGRAMSIDHNAIYHASDFGVQLNTVRGGSVYCNFFYDCGREDTTQGHESGAMDLYEVSGLDISHNDFDRSWYGFRIASRVDSTTYIHHNRFYQISLCLYIGVLYPQLGPSYPTLRMNCIQVTENFVYVDQCDYNRHAMDADSNYWEGLDGVSLESRIHDCHDSPICPCVFHSTVLGACPDAGVCNN